MLNVKSHRWLVITGPNSAMLSDSLCSGSKTWVEQHGRRYPIGASNCGKNVAGWGEREIHS